MNIIALQGDITKSSADAIVNAANNALTDGAGVNGAIHAAAGPQLSAYCNKLNGCATGEAIITPGFNLAAKYIIHTVGPVWRGGHQQEAELLALCYKNCLILADQCHDIKTLAFPAISCGVFGYPIEQATKIAVNTINALAKTTHLQEIIFVCYDAATLQIYQNLM